MYFLAINRLKVATDEAQLDQFMPQHQEWIQELVEKNVMVQAGKWGTIGSAFLFASDSLEKAHKILAQDPLMLHDLVDYQMHEFYPEVKIST